ncbi:hypothetical protein BGZ65_003695, partial [Modicella reniformis]
IPVMTKGVREDTVQVPFKQSPLWRCMINLANRQHALGQSRLQHPGTVRVLLRNLRPQDGLCNGTRLIYNEFHRRVIVAEIIAGAKAGTTVLIPRISLTT